MPARVFPVARILGLLLVLYSSTLLPPVLISLWYRDGEAIHFLTSMGLTFAAGIVIWFPSRLWVQDLRNRDGFLIVAFFWVGLGAFGALPFLFGPHLSYVDSLFESVSGFTTTGATVIVGLDQLPPSLLYYRQQLQWLGGAGVIVLAVAILPMLGVGGMQMFKAETPGPMKDEKLTPRIAHASRALWLIYVSLTIACALAYWLAGMGLFDAVAHALSTVATAGFSTHDASMAYFQSPAIEGICTLFMLLGAINFSLHFRVWGSRSVGHYLKDTELRVYLIIIAGAVTLVTLTLWIAREYPSLLESLRYASFQVVSAMTTTGFTTATFAHWPLLLPVLLVFASFIGGCAGSTAGGMKMMRVLVLSKQGVRELFRLIHPNAVVPVKVGDRALSERTLDAVWGFFATYVLTFVILMLLMMATGVDQVTAFSAIASGMNNLGPGLGEIHLHFYDLNDMGKLLVATAMLLGRLEIFTILVLLSPAFWRR
jgi:trk system potassium uptake protein TrkH